MTRLLALETSAETCSVALYLDGAVSTFSRHAPMKHAELLLPAISELMAESGVTLKELDAIAFGRGPGSFTSLRIGIGVVQGLAWGADLPVVPVSSLAAVAQQAAEADGGATTALCVAMDARMQEVYTADFSFDGTVVRPQGEERVCRPEQVEIPQVPFVAAGNGFDRFEALSGAGAAAVSVQGHLWPQADSVCTLALDWLQHNRPLPAAQAQPSYVRNEVASKPGN